MKAAFRTLSAVLLSGSIYACSPEDAAQAPGVLLHASALNFGDVAIGVRKPLELEISNRGSGDLVIKTFGGEAFAKASYEFGVSESSFTLSQGESKTITVYFQPFAISEVPVDSKLLMESDRNDLPFFVDLRGRGIAEGLTAQPNPIDFGTLLRGASREQDVVITNRTSESVDIKSAMENGAPAITTKSGNGVFEIVSPAIQSNGSLLGESIVVAPGDSIRARVRYTPDAAGGSGPDQAAWTVSSCDSDICNFDIDLVGQATTNAIDCGVSPLDFNDVSPGATATVNLSCTNLTDEIVELGDWWIAQSSASEFSVETHPGQAVAIPAQSSYSIVVSLSPTLADLGNTLTGTLVIDVYSGATGLALDDVEMTLVGRVGGPEIVVAPTAIDFGQTAIGAEGARTVTVRNDGYNPLIIGSIETAGAFSASSGGFTVNVQESATFDIVFDPTTAGSASSEVVLNTNDSDKPRVTIAVAGQAVSMPACSYTVQPASIDFGLVQMPNLLRQPMLFQNVGTNDCLLGSFRVVQSQSSAFHLDPSTANRMVVAAGQSAVVQVQYTPTNSTEDIAGLRFYVSDPSGPNPTVPLRGVSAGAALTSSPKGADFGRLSPGCSSSNRTITISNNTSNIWTINNIAGPSGTEIELVSVPATPLTLSQGATTDIVVRYTPSDMGWDVAQVRLDIAGQSEPMLIPLVGQGVVNPFNEDKFTQLTKVDVLFVIDNSCSMSEEQSGLGANFASFIEPANNVGVDYQIATITTDVDNCANPQTADRPALVSQGQCGYFADGNELTANADWRIIDENDLPSPADAFGDVALQGVNGSASERGFEAARRALSDPLINGWNGGFLRADADLSIVFVSDEEEQSQNTTDFYVGFFRSIKGPSQSVTVSAVAGDTPDGCGGFQADAGFRYMDAVTQTGGLYESICTTDWAQTMQNIGASVFGYRLRFPLSQEADPSSLEVFVDSAPIPAQWWTYQSQGNFLEFSPLAVPAPGAEIAIRYASVCL